MTTAYLSAIPLAISVAEAQLIPNSLAWAGSAWGLILTAVFLAPATCWVASPPFLAHLFTFTVGVALLT